MTDNPLAEGMANSLTYFADRTLARLDGLTDAEYLWEPVPECWSVRAVTGEGVVDLSANGTQFTDDPPFTTIAWRLWHLGAVPEPHWPPRAATPRELADGWFSRGPASPRAFLHGADAVAAFADHWQNVAADVAAYDDGELMELIGPIGGPYADSTIHGLLFHVADELAHHAAEVGLLRDLYARMVTA